MSTTQLVFVIGLVSLLIIVPILAILLVPRIVPDDPKVEAEVMGSSDTSFESFGDFWDSVSPHLRAMRDRLIWSLVAIAIGTAIGFGIVNSSALLGDQLPNLLIKHFVPPDVELQYIATAEGFVSYMRIALVIGVAIAMPVVIYQVVRFFIPAMLPRERRILYIALPIVTDLFLAGLVFGWFITLPAALDFLLRFGTSDVVKSRPSFESFISIVARLLLWNGIIFELPAVIYLLVWLGVVNTQQLARTRRYAIVIVTIVAAVITPTGDPFNLLLLAVPMYLLYELGIWMARFVPERARAPSEAPKPAS